MVPIRGSLNPPRLGRPLSYVSLVSISHTDILRYARAYDSTRMGKHTHSQSLSQSIAPTRVTRLTRARIAQDRPKIILQNARATPWDSRSNGASTMTYDFVRAQHAELHRGDAA